VRRAGSPAALTRLAAPLTRPVQGIHDSRLLILDWPSPRQVDIPAKGISDSRFSIVDWPNPRQIDTTAEGIADSGLSIVDWRRRLPSQFKRKLKHKRLVAQGRSRGHLDLTAFTLCVQLFAL